MTNMNHSVHYLYKKPGITDECSDSVEISLSESDLLNLRVAGNAAGDLKVKNYPNLGKHNSMSRRSENYQLSNKHLRKVDLRDDGKKHLSEGLHQRIRVQKISPKYRRSQRLKHDQTHRDRTGYESSGNNLYSVRSEVCNTVQRQLVDRQDRDRGGESDRRLVERRMNFRFSDKKNKDQVANFIGQDKAPFPFRKTPSGNLKIIPEQVLFTSRKVSILIDNPDSTNVNIEGDMDKINKYKNIMPPIPSKFFQKPESKITDSGELLSSKIRSSDMGSDKEMEEMGGDGPECLKPEMKLERLGYQYGKPIEYTGLRLPTKTNLYHELYQRISNYIHTDVQVIIGMEEFSCHSMVLQTYSEFFNNHADVKRIELPQHKVSSNAFVCIYDWMITGTECMKLVRRENVLELFVASQYLEIKELEEQCWAFVLSDVVFDEDTAFLLYVDARKLKLSSVKDLMLPRIKKFFLMLVSLQDFLDLEIDELCVLLTSSYIVVSCEMDVLMSTIRWLKYDWENRTKHLVQLMSCVRFGLIAPWQLVDIKRNRENPELMEIMNVPEITKMVDDGLSFVIIKYWYGSNGGDDYVHWLELLNLAEPQERNWTGNEKNYETYRQFLNFIWTYRQEYILEKNKTGMKTSKDEIPPQPCYPPSDLVSRKESTAKDFFAASPASTENRNEEEEIYYDTDDRSIPSPTSSKSFTVDEAASTIQSAYREYRARKMKGEGSVYQTRRINEKKDGDRKQGIYAQNIKVLSMFETQKNNERRTNNPKKSYPTIVTPRKNSFLIEGSLFSNDCETVIVFGGLNSSSSSDIHRNSAQDIYHFCPVANDWKFVGKLPEPRHCHSTVFFRGRVYLAGGANPLYDDVKDKKTVVNTVWSYNPVTRIWHREPNLITPRRNFGLVMINMKLYAIGGQDRNGRMLASVECFEDGTWTEVAPLKSPRMGMACARYRNCIWVAGGVCSTKRNPLTNAVECYDTKLDRWTRIENLRIPRSFATLFAMNDQLYLIGGAGRSADREIGTISISAVDIWDPNDRAWKLKAELCIPRHGHCIAYLGTQILIIGGVTTVYMRPLSNIECYCSDRNSWLPGLSPLPQPLSSHSCVTLPPASLM